MYSRLLLSQALYEPFYMPYLMPVSQKHKRLIKNT